MAKRPTDVNQLGKWMVDQATGTAPVSDDELRSAAAKMLGRLGGLKGGPRRAEVLTERQASAIGKKAAAARWKGHKKTKPATKAKKGGK